ncbi:MAG: radical SAM protein [Planctomycetota bacterium]
MRVQEIEIKTALVRSRIPGVDFVINPYLGCSHGCRYCYATFMRKYSHHNQGTPWGEFVEVKTNIVDVLRSELQRKRRPGHAHLSSVCDPYQPVERHYRLTRRCLELLRDFGWEVDVLTRSSLVTRDIDVLTACSEVLVGLSVPTDDERVRRILEPRSTSIATRLTTLRRLREAGLSTWVFIAPVLPMNPERLHALVSPWVDFVMIDPLNYPGQVAALFRAHGWGEALTSTYAGRTREKLERLFGPQLR